MSRCRVLCVVNGVERVLDVEPRTTLADALREDLDLTGVHLGCEHGVCGACTVLLDGATARSCLLLAVQADGHMVTTVEGLASDSELHAVQEGFLRAWSFQCGFCTPGFVMTVVELLHENPTPTRDEVREALSGNLCRCTGYEGIVDGVCAAIELQVEQNA